MNHKALIFSISFLIVAIIVGGVVYVEWPTQQLTVGTSAAEAQAGIASANPSLIAVNEPADVTITIQLTDSRLIPASVNLQRLDASGKVVAVLGNLNDSGANGDAVANDKTFTIRKNFTEATPTPVQLQVSWGLKGVLKRAVSNIVTLSPAFEDGIGVRITASSPPTDFMNTTITIDTFDLEGLSELFISTIGFEKNIGKLVNINWGDQSPNQLGSVTYDLSEIVPPSSLGVDIEQLGELQLLVEIRGNSGKSISATTTIHFR